VAAGSSRLRQAFQAFMPSVCSTRANILFIFALRLLPCRSVPFCRWRCVYSRTFELKRWMPLFALISLGRSCWLRLLLSAYGVLLLTTTPLMNATVRTSPLVCTLVRQRRAW